MAHNLIIWCENVGAIFLTSNPVFHARMKHIEVYYDYIREKLVWKELVVRFISTVDQLADIFTKGLTSHHFSVLNKLRDHPQPISLRGVIGI